MNNAAMKIQNETQPMTHAEFEQKLMAKGASTVGAFLADRRERKESVLARRTGSKASDLYEFYPQRSMLEEEVDKIWDKQSSFNASLFTEDNKQVDYLEFA